MKRKKVNEIVWVAVTPTGVVAVGLASRYRGIARRKATLEGISEFRIAKCRLVEVTEKRKVKR